MGKVYFVFGIHNHQPVGNFHHVFERAYERCYLPFIREIEKFPRIKFGLHNSGCLYDWILENKKEYIGIVKKLVGRNQVEIVSGGYYEPILPLISDEDRRGQINFMNDFIKRQFNTTPRGIWTAERVWEPYLAKVINDCNLKYTFLDDTHFRYAGFRDKEFFGYYTTEEAGKELYVFPISKTLRYKMPFSEAHEAIDILNGFAKEEDVLVTFFDDGEKFGLWPHTYEWVYEGEWLRKFLTLLNESENIETLTPSEALEQFSSEGIIYLPTASYEEMGKWVLEPESFYIYENLENFLKGQGKFDEYKDFIRGGFFRNFYRKYGRLNYMHKRMLSLSRKVHEAADPKKDRDIFTNLWKAETNCGYWHGIFGGFYLGHIRGAIYENLIHTESLLDKKCKCSQLACEEEDIDLDGNKEIILKNKNIIACFSRKGAALLELSLRKPAINLINTITRREESYHKKIRENVKKESDKVATIHDTIIQKEEGLDKFLIYDKYERLGLVDHLLEKDLSIDDFNLQNGINTLSNELYKVAIKKEKGGINLNYNYGCKDLSFSKRINFSTHSGFETQYKFDRKNLLQFYNFGVEFNLSLPSIDNVFKLDKKKGTPLGEPGVWEEVASFAIVDYYKKIRLEFEFTKADLFTLPLYSVSSSESGFERVYQELSLLFKFSDIKDSLKLAIRINKV